ncbi:MAG: hypothetical protein K2F81_00985 [Ruminococcus sp.]|nr:hypothetical protein [Ruminococcus sp.]
MNNFVIKEITDLSIGYRCPLCHSDCGSVKLENGFIRPPDLCRNCGYKFSCIDNNDKNDTVLTKCTIDDAFVGNTVIVSKYFSEPVSMPRGMPELVGEFVTISAVDGEMVQISENNHNGNLWINICMFEKYREG